MSLVDHSRVQIVLGQYGTTNAQALLDPAWLPKVQEYRRNAGARMVPIAREDIRKRLPEGEYHVSRKVDGEFTTLLIEGDEVVSLNPGGTVRVGLPFAAEAAALAKGAGLKRVIVPGELYVERPDGKRARVHDVGRAVLRPDGAAELATLRFAAFDLMEPAHTAYADTWKMISHIFEKGERVRAVDAAWVTTVDAVSKKFDTWVEGEGSEGIVVRSDSAGVFKVKLKHTIDAVVVGFSEGVDDRKGLLHDVLVALMRADGSFHLFGRVGGGFSDEERRTLLADFKDATVPSEYTEVNSENVAYHMVRPECVIEFSCLDVVSTTTRGAPIERMVVTWNATESRWQVNRRLPLASAIGPSFVRRRTDKQVRPEDLSLRQVADIVDVPLVDRDASRIRLATSEVLRREVYTKVMKGQKMVRKLVMWKTNKSETSADYPEFVVHLTDFSPNRKTPLEREVRVSNSREQIDALWASLAAESFGKGWTKA